MKTLYAWAVFCAGAHSSWLTRPLFFYLCDAEKRRDALTAQPNVIKAWIEKLDIDGVPSDLYPDPVLAVERVLDVSCYGKGDAKPWDIVKREILERTIEIRWVGTRPIRVIHQVVLWGDSETPLATINLMLDESPLHGISRVLGDAVASRKLRRLQDAWKISDDPHYPDFPAEYLIAQYKILG